MWSSQFTKMLRIALIGLALGLIAYVATAPDISRPNEDKNEGSGIALAGQNPNAILDKDDNLKDGMESHSKVIVGDGKDSGLVQSDLEDDEKDLANKGLVSDIINATISGVQFGIGLGTTNGTLDRLCIKIGGITMAGCRRTAAIDLGSKASKAVPETATSVV